MYNFNLLKLKLVKLQTGRRAFFEWNAVAGLAGAVRTRRLRVAMVHHEADLNMPLHARI